MPVDFPSSKSQKQRLLSALLALILPIDVWYSGVEQPALAFAKQRRKFEVLSGCGFADSKFGIAGWSSPVARQAHNLKVRGSNPLPATKFHNKINKMRTRRRDRQHRRFSAATK